MAIKSKKGGRQCKATKNNGHRCRANAVNSSNLCFFHDPANRDKFKAASVKGGVNRLKPKPIKTLSKDNPDIKIASAENVIELISATINQVRCGEIDVRIGNAIGYLSGIALRAIELGKFEDRLIQLEREISKGN